MRFMSWDGYHHHLGINVLEGRGAGLVEPDVRGVQGFGARRIKNVVSDPDGVEIGPAA